MCSKCESKNENATSSLFQDGKRGGCVESAIVAAASNRYCYMLHSYNCKKYGGRKATGSKYYVIRSTCRIPIVQILD